MTAVWPATLPTFFLADGYGEAPIMPRASFPPDVGPPIERPKGTYRSREIRCATIMTPGQLEDFEEFVFDDLGQACLPFDGPHPRGTGDTVRLKIKAEEKPYTIEMHGTFDSSGQNVLVSMTLLVLGA